MKQCKVYKPSFVINSHLSRLVVANKLKQQPALSPVKLV